MLKDIQTTGRTKITLLGSDKKVQWKQKGNDIEVIMPLLYVDELPCDYAWVLKLEDFRVSSFMFFIHCLDISGYEKV
ncbi:hypothetical protein NXV16_00060 [Bacteroides fragilis]|nr:hypothetical protein [Bacteroides fragilis]